MDKISFRHWLKPVVDNVFEAYCTVCKKRIQLGTMGVKALDSHAKSTKHMKYVRGKEQTPSITAGFPPASHLAASAPAAPPATNTANVNVRVDLRTSFGSTPMLKAEVLWTLHTIAKHQSYNGNEGISELFKCMFPNSDISSTFTCGADKMAYIAKFGLAIHIKDELVSKVNKSLFVLMFDESLNEITKTKQLDVHVRFWDEGQVHSRYLGSQFMGHSTAQDLLSHLKECMDKLDLRGLVSLSMDGPSVNWKLFDLFQKEQAKQYGGVQLVCVRSCGLHMLHNAFKCRFTAWQLDKLLRAMHTLFHNVPTRREDYITVTKSSVFPLSFCAHRWVENLPVVERALVVWLSLLLYMEAVKTKKLPNPGTGDVILQQFDSLLSLESRSEDFLSFPPMQRRLDLFLSSVLREPYPELWAFCKKLLILSHGQATVERGFSINKEVEFDNIQEDTVVTRRLVCDYIMQHGGVTQVPLTKELLASVAAARARYRVHLDTERKKRVAEAQALKRKGAEDQLQELRGKRRRLQEVSEGLARDADRLAEEAEGKAGSKMADLITRSNLLRRGHKEKLAELAVLDKEIAAKSAELRS
ncbi:hypothetical protein ABVT39_007828 [Epinephelus coioides]